MTIQPYQYQIGDIIFGLDTQIPVQKVEIQAYNVNNQDFQVQRSDENRFGIDTLTPAPLVFTLSVLNNYPLENAVDFSTAAFPTELFASNATQLNQLAKEWKDPALRLSWGATKPLLFCDRSGRVSRIYGRPGKFTHTPRSREGRTWIDVQAEFRRADTYVHSDIEYTIEPIIANDSPVNVSRLDGDADSWLRILIYGPATNPTITYGDNVIETNSVIGAGVVAEISSYPWQRRYVDSNGINRRTEIIGDTLYLDQIKFPADTNYDINWTCTGDNVDTQMFFLWREAYNVI